MNKTLLLIIVDFLFLNLIALTRWDRAEPHHPATAPVALAPARGASAEADLVDTMRVALEDQRRAGDRLQAQVASRDAALAEHERSLGEERRREAGLSGALEAARREREGLAGRLEAAAREAEAQRSALALARHDLEVRAAEAAARASDVEALKHDQEEARRRIEALVVAADRAEQERRRLAGESDRLRAEVEAERAGRDAAERTASTLAQGVGQLARSSGELTQEIRDNTPVSANVLFQAASASRVTLGWHTVRRGLFGDSGKDQAAVAAVVTAGGRSYALLESGDSPFGPDAARAGWVRTAVTLEGPGGVKGLGGEVRFLDADPRVLAIPLGPGLSAALASKAYPVAAEPFRFPEATLIERDGRGYGDLAFQLDPDHPGYVRVDNRLFKRLLGDFSPSQGDLVLSRRGELLGIMVSPSWCALVRTLASAEVLPLGPDEPAGRTQAALDRVAARLGRMPPDLQ